MGTSIRFDDYAAIALGTALALLALSVAMGIAELLRARRHKRAESRFAESTELSTALLATIATQLAEAPTTQPIKVVTYGDKRFRTGAIQLPILLPEEIEPLPAEY